MLGRNSSIKADVFSIQGDDANNNKSGIGRVCHITHSRISYRTVTLKSLGDHIKIETTHRLSGWYHRCIHVTDAFVTFSNEPFY